MEPVHEAPFPQAVAEPQWDSGRQGLRDKAKPTGGESAQMRPQREGALGPRTSRANQVVTMGDVSRGAAAGETGL